MQSTKGVTNMSTTATPAPTPLQTEASKIIGLLFTLGTAAAAIFVKNANHVGTASTIIGILQDLLPQIEGLL